MTDTSKLCDVVRDSIPQPNPDWVEWAEEFVVLPGSARSKHFRLAISPWIREPVDRAINDNRTRVVTFMKPVQSAGSVAGEVILLYWMNFARGFLQYNWSNDKRAKERWDSRIEGILKSCPPLAEKMANISFMTKGEMDLGNVFFRMQGSFVPDNLDSDSVPLQINEEVHAWEAGHLKKARNRSTAVWNYKSIDISNAGLKGDQLDKAFADGTGQRWMVKCPGCGDLHFMRTKWDAKHPELGGLRYDADGCRRGRFEYDYNKLRPTIYFQMPCGFKIHNDDVSGRRRLSLSGRYSEPLHIGAELSHRSYTYEAVSVDYIDWMQLIKDKHDALRARSFGDPEPFRRYLCERECRSYDVEEVPMENPIEVSTGLKQGSASGLEEPRLRLFSLDRQAGAAGDLPHWWVVVRDVKWDESAGKLRSRLVHESKQYDEDVLIAILRDDLKCNMWQGVADSGDDTTHVYLFCMKHGINAIKGGSNADEFYVHKNGARRIFSQERPLHLMINNPPKYQYVSINSNGRADMIPDPREPMFWSYSKGQIRERLHWMRTETIYETPDDISEDYQKHQEAEERVEKVRPADGFRYHSWVQTKKRNDLFVCEAYIAMQVDQAGMIFSEVLKEQKEQTK